MSISNAEGQIKHGLQHWSWSIWKHQKKKGKRAMLQTCWALSRKEKPRRLSSEARAAFRNKWWPLPSLAGEKPAVLRPSPPSFHFSTGDAKISAGVHSCNVKTARASMRDRWLWSFSFWFQQGFFSVTLGFSMNHCFPFQMVFRMLGLLLVLPSLMLKLALGGSRESKVRECYRPEKKEK